MFMDNLTMKFERKNLYDEIWDIWLTAVSKKYGLNGNIPFNPYFYLIAYEYEAPLLF